jgi:hypothetical protein
MKGTVRSLRFVGHGIAMAVDGASVAAYSPVADEAGGVMSNRILLWTLAALAVMLVLVPIVGMLGMINAGGMIGDGTMGGAMMGMGVFGTLWLLLAIVVIVALVVWLVRPPSKV